MKKLSKLKIKKIIIWSLIILLVGSLAYKQRLEIGVFLSCHKDYSPIGLLDYVSADNEDKQLVVSFDYRDYANNSERLNIIRNTYDSIKEHFLANPKSPYRNYTLTIRFMRIAYGFSIENISADSEKIKITAVMPDDCIEVSIKELSKIFPNTTHLHLNRAHYTDISEIDNFNNLEYIWFGWDFSREEYDYIKKKFPNCEIVE